MDDLLGDFLTETSESLDIVDVELVRFEQEPNNTAILSNIFRLVHTIKGTCGFLDLPRLEALAHAAETLMGKLRDGAAVTPQAVSLTLSSIDRLKDILGELGAHGQEPAGSDDDLIQQLIAMAEATERSDWPDAHSAESGSADLPTADHDRALKPGEVTLEELERVFRETEGPDLAASRTVQKTVEETKSEELAATDDSTVAETEPAMPVQAATLRVSVDTLEHLITTVSELVLTRNQLLDISRRHADSEFKGPLQRLSNVTAELQDGVMQTRMQPIGNAWKKLPRIVRDLANELGKEIELEMIGQETELDRQVLELIKDPLTHMVRNSADHGLEDSDKRIAAGKQSKGLIRLSTYHEGGQIIVTVADDGRGLDAERIRAKLAERGVVSEAELEKMSEAQLHRYIFDPGFSTAQSVTAVSGRGVGMDVVRTNIEKIGGSVDVKSVYREGTTFTIKIPLTLAIIAALIVECDGQRYAIPQLSVVELVRAQHGNEHRVEKIMETPVLRLRNALLPLVSMRNLLAGSSDGDNEVDEFESGFIVVMQAAGSRFGIVVDGVFHTEEIVVKPMSRMLRDIELFSGNTILGDGSVIMIVDPNGLAHTVCDDVAEAIERDQDDRDSPDAARQMTSMLLFRAGGDEPKAVPLSLVTRLEEIDIARIEPANGGDAIQYRGALMPLLPVNSGVTRRQEGTQPVLVFSDSGRSMGLMIDEITDIVESELDIEIRSDEPGIIGSAVIEGAATAIVDVGHFLPLAFHDWLGRSGGTAVEAGPRSVMLVDDSPFFRNMLAPVLSSAGYRVTAFQTAREALAALKRGEAFDLIVSDIEMPEMDGFEFARQLSLVPEHKSIPLIALSSHGTPAVVAQGREVGFDEFVAKFDRRGLLASLDGISGRIGQEAAA